VCIQLELRVNPGYVFPGGEHDARDGRTSGKVLPVGPCDLGGSQRPTDDRHAQLFLVLVANRGFCVDHGKERIVRDRLYTLRQPFGSQSIAHDVKVGIVDRIVLVASCRDGAKGTGIQDFTATKR